jgi:hypothetical protein
LAPSSRIRKRGGKLDKINSASQIRFGRISIFGLLGFLPLLHNFVEERAGERRLF